MNLVKNAAGKSQTVIVAQESVSVKRRTRLSNGAGGAGSKRRGRKVRRQSHGVSLALEPQSIQATSTETLGRYLCRRIMKYFAAIISAFRRTSKPIQNAIPNTASSIAVAIAIQTGPPAGRLWNIFRFNP